MVARALKSIYNGERGDRMIWFIIIALGMVSLLAVYSSSMGLAFKNNSTAHLYLLQHFLILSVGFVIIYIVSLMNHIKFSTIGVALMILAVLLLVYTLFFGSSINGASRWIRIPIINITFQTSDFAKLALVIYLARILTTKQEKIKDFKAAFVPILFPVAIVCFLIAPFNLSTAMLIFLTSMVMMFIGRVRVKFMAGLAAMGVGMLGLLYILWWFFPNHVRVQTWSNRIQDFMANGDGSFQNVQAKIAIANGGFFGAGVGDGGHLRFLPSAYADFIYASICEEYGVFGGAIILILFVWFFIRVVVLVAKSPKTFGTLLAIGLALLITVQALTNMAVSVHLLPVTGLTLPLVSKGGTSLIFTSIALGMILSVSRYVEKSTKSAIKETNKNEAVVSENDEVNVTEAVPPFDIAYVVDDTKKGTNIV
ncbi:MAG TPA: FtsW/RodA/SpoVE family cell cycle protein [Saprospiraceae bacterium]|nr:FtsW/RodA/SpoVE family cell cycle protein [Saprospiraceae bacterium]MCC6689388.1 FtsW/RodA/SpoVE family cell cycle protein [Saprospiraceae bacterium]HMV23380.1 FtsW/RodA/SpoVE family cell cycle protein [Saprospiraceae bacterium]HMX86426.1 FtsW/RodA/SpoVE family cell cycle protein [Saprospiraceae bacterium]HMZ72077.1 FtsW/RodA/SpoVE family cell cycle protein [Saprospiraceae bacterium]